MRPIHVLILYNEPVLPTGHADYESEHEVLQTVEAVRGFLGQPGFQVSCLGVSKEPRVLLDGLRQQRPDVVFNLFEGTADQGHTEASLAGLLDWLRIPFTGSPCAALCLARDKILAKHLFQGAGLPTPEFLVVEGLPVPDCSLDWPVIVKPGHQDASVGMDHGSVVTDQYHLNRRVAWLLDNYGPPVLVEEFIAGRELDVAVIEAPDVLALPVSEVLFVNQDPDDWPIVTYDAKWKPGSRDFVATPTCYPAKVSHRLAKRLQAHAQKAFRLLGCRDYARVDFRVRPSGKPYLLEVNPNPDYHPTAGFAEGLATAGVTHAQFTADLVRRALARGASVAPGERAHLLEK
jgi:D-alanine-D-alanine ligase